MLCFFIFLILSIKDLNFSPQFEIRKKINNILLSKNYASSASITLAFLMIAGISMLGGWITESVQINPRQAQPFLLLFVPSIFALVGLKTLSLRNEGSRIILIVSNFSILIIIGLIFYSHEFLIIHELHNGSKSSFNEQKKVASIIKNVKPKSLYVDGWWQNPEYELLTGIQGTPYKTGNSQLLIVQDYQINGLGVKWIKY